MMLANLLATCSLAWGENSATSPATIAYSTINGRELYVKLCAKCHGTEGHPPADIAGLLDPPPADLLAPNLHYGNSAEEIVRLIREGRSANMIHYHHRLTEEQIGALGNFILELRAHRGAPPTQ